MKNLEALSQERHRAIKKLRTDPTEKNLWDVILLYSGMHFENCTGLPFF